VIEPIPQELAELISKEPAVPPVGGYVETRLLSRLDASVDRAAAAAATGAAASAGSHVLKGLAVKAGLVVLGFSAGFALHAQLTPPAPAPIVIAPPPLPRVEAPVPEPTPVVEPAPAPAPPPQAPAKASAPPRKAEPSGESTLEAERRLLEPARAALAREQPQDALTAVAAHATRFPAGELAEERDALWVQALAQAGDHDAARAKAEAFKRAYPQSLLLPVVENAAASPRP
jgi:hypothetical protein